MAYVDIIQSAQVFQCEGGTAIPTFQLHSADNSSTWIRGGLLKLASGVIATVKAITTVAVVDTDDMPVGGVYFIAGKPQAAATSDKVSVMQIDADMIFRGVLLQSSTDSLPTAPESIVGNKYGLVMVQGKWGVDKDTNSSKQLVEIVAVEGQREPFQSSYLNLIDHSGTDVMYPWVYFKFLRQIVTPVGA
jgi:hypothetical protein